MTDHTNRANLFSALYHAGRLGSALLFFPTAWIVGCGLFGDHPAEFATAAAFLLLLSGINDLRNDLADLTQRVSPAMNTATRNGDDAA